MAELELKNDAIDNHANRRYSPRDGIGDRDRKHINALPGKHIEQDRPYHTQINERDERRP